MNTDPTHVEPTRVMAVMPENVRMRELVAVLYVVGTVVTAVGVLLAYRRARRDLRRLEKVDALHESHADPNPIDDYEAVLAGDDEAVAARAKRRTADQDELRRALEMAGIASEPPRYKDLGLPLEYWAKRSALRDAIASFRSGGLVALAGVLVSTVASVWSLYLPTA